VYSERNAVPAVGFSEDAILVLQTYSFPGNVRELENIVERAVLMARGRVVMASHFPLDPELARKGDSNGNGLELLSLPFHKALAELERRLIVKALSESGGNKTEAANRLQINRRLLYNKIDEHKIGEDQ
jgi:DNA-binding NtrC family response regulator